MGKIKKIIGAFVHAPNRFDDLAGRIADVSQMMNERFDSFDEQLLRYRPKFTKQGE